MKLPPSLEAFLCEVMPAIVGTARRDGSIQMKPLWYEYRDGEIWLNGTPTRRWLRRARRSGRLALFFIDAQDMWRHALIHCRVQGTATEGADAHIDRLSMRYLGVPYRAPKVDRLILRLEPASFSGIDSRKPWA